MSHQWPLCFEHMFSFTLTENPPRRPSVCFQLKPKEAFFPERRVWLFKYTSDCCRMAFLLNSHERPVRELAAAAEGKNNINMNIPYSACQAE